MFQLLCTKYTPPVVRQGILMGSSPTIPKVQHRCNCFCPAQGASGLADRVCHGKALGTSMFCGTIHISRYEAWCMHVKLASQYCRSAADQATWKLRILQRHPCPLYFYRSALLLSCRCLPGPGRRQHHSCRYTFGSSSIGGRMGRCCFACRSSSQHIHKWQQVWMRAA